MFLATTWAVVALATSGADVEPDFLTRVERTPLHYNGKPFHRIEKDEAGNVVLLRLDEMRLTSEDFRAIAAIGSLRSLSLRRTNVADRDLEHLTKLRSLKSLILTATEISDEAVPSLAKLPSLRSLCLGNVCISPEAIGELKKQRPSLALGYYQRKP
jgi:hypothetical protein